MNVNGIKILVSRKRIKNMHLYVKPPHGRVEVSVPESVSDQSIEMFVRTHISWIRKQLENFERQPRQTERQYVSGESLYVWGKKYYLQVQYSYKGNSLVLSGNKAILTVRQASTPLQRETFVNEWYRSLLKTEISKRLPEWENNTGLHCSSWQVKYMTTRWGTCNTATGKIWLNLQLAKKTLESLDYIILHELVHLVEKDHGERFVSMMDQFMPFWREIRKKLNGQILDYME